MCFFGTNYQLCERALFYVLSLNHYVAHGLQVVEELLTITIQSTWQLQEICLCVCYLVYTLVLSPVISVSCTSENVFMKGSICIYITKSTQLHFVNKPFLYLTRCFKYFMIKQINSQSTNHMCVTVFDACKSNPCQHSVRCDNTTSGFHCTCKEHYEGKTCSGRYYYYSSKQCNMQFSRKHPKVNAQLCVHASTCIILLKVTTAL